MATFLPKRYKKQKETKSNKNLICSYAQHTLCLSKSQKIAIKIFAENVVDKLKK